MKRTNTTRIATGTLRTISAALAVALMASAAAKADDLDLQIDSADLFDRSVAEPAPSTKDQHYLESISLPGAVSWTLKFGAKLSGNYNSNITSSTTDEEGAFATKPSLFANLVRDSDATKISATLGLASDRASEFSSKYNKDAVTANITIDFKKIAIAGFAPTVSYDFARYDTPFFSTRKSTYNDFSLALARKFALANGQTIATTLKSTYRVADPAASDRSAVAGEIVWNDPLSDTFAIAVTAGIGEVWYRSGTNDGRQDTALSAKFEAKQVINDQLALKFNVAYSDNLSNFPGARVSGWVVGPTLEWGRSIRVYSTPDVDD